MKKNAFLWKCEQYFFALFVVLTAIPVLSNKFFPTIDGPAHLHNGNLLRQLWFCNQSFSQAFFDVNTHLNSNFIDHVWFAVAGTFLPAFLTEKSILLFYVIALPYSFRFLVKKLVRDNDSARIASYLIFSFVYSFTFRLGFFNFSIGIPVFFWSLGLWVAYREMLTTKRVATLCFLTTVLYISHIFNFSLFGIIVFANEIQYFIYLKSLKGLFKKLSALFVIFIPGITLSAFFFISNSTFEHEPARYLPAKQLIGTIIGLGPIITLDYKKEGIFATIIGIVLCVLLLMVLYDFIKKRKENRGTAFTPYWSIPALLVLILFFIFPDWVASGGFISIRWALFFFYVILILIAAKGLPVKQLLVPVMVLLITQLFFLNYHNAQTKALSADAEILNTAGQYMENNKVLLPLNFSANWMQINFACYMATEKNIINLDNYEPTKPHFPLFWKKGEAVYDLMPGYGNRNPPCINVDAYEQKTHHRIDYISRFCFNGDLADSCANSIQQELNKRFVLIYESENKKLQLYKRKSGT